VGDADGCIERERHRGEESIRMGQRDLHHLGHLCNPNLTHARGECGRRGCMPLPLAGSSACCRGFRV